MSVVANTIHTNYINKTKYPVKHYLWWYMAGGVTEP